MSSLKTLKEELVESTCVKQSPLMKLRHGTNAPSLNYNVPLTSCFNVYPPFLVQFKRRHYLVILYPILLDVEYD